MQALSSDSALATRSGTPMRLKRAVLALCNSVFVALAHGMASAPLPPVANPNPAINVTSDKIATIGGAFRVDESGNASYSIPIYLPGGTAGVTPTVTLNYSSGGGNGLLGKGGSIGGLSGISRCRQTLHQDDQAVPIAWSNQDRFCIDGQRLVIETGTYGTVGSTYRTEVDGFRRIRALGGTLGKPDYFEVDGKDGSVTRYGDAGSTTTSEREARDATGNETGLVYSWAISQFKDSVGNAINYDYFNDQYGHRIDKIKYGYGSGSTAKAQVEFAYKTRTDMTKAYTGGYRFAVERLLDKVTVRNNEVLASGGLLIVREYKLTYQAPTSAQPFNQMAKVEECLSTNCIKPTVFAWTPSDINFSSTKHITSLANHGDEYPDHKLVDINGDGLLDLVWQQSDESNGHIDTTRYFFSMGQNPSGSYAAPSGPFFVEQNNISHPYSWNVIDYNGDGYLDVMIPISGVWNVFYGSATGIASTSTATSLNVGNQEKPTRVIDFNSDGLVDFMYEDKKYIRLMERSLVGSKWVTKLSATPILVDDLFPLYKTTYVSTTGLWDHRTTSIPDTIPSGDFNGDGRMDLLVAQNQLICSNNSLYCSTGTLSAIDGGAMVLTSTEGPGGMQFEEWNAPFSTAGSEYRVGDINGDGLADYLTNVSGSWQVFVSTGAGFKSLQTLGTIPNDSRLQLADYNHDGLLDVLYPDGGSLKYRLFSAANETFSAVQTSGVAISNNNKDVFYIADVNGDGRNDYVNSYQKKITVQYGNGTPEVIKSIDIGLGMVTDVTYQPLSNALIYERYTDANTAGWDRLPIWTQTLGKTIDGGAIFDITPATQVVSVVKSTAPRANNSVPDSVDYAAKSEIYYLYKGAKIQAGGQGFLGFDQIWSVDTQSQIWTATQYRQDFPFVGRPVVTETFKFLGGLSWRLLDSKTSYWGLEDWSVPAQVTKAPFPVYHMLSQTLSYDLASGKEFSYVGSVNTVDNWGNVLTTEVDSYDTNSAGTRTLVSELDTLNVYAPAGLDATYAKEKGRLSRSQVTHKRPSKTSLVRTSDFTYYLTGSKKGLLNKEMLAPGTNDQLDTTYEYNAQGNITKKLVAGASGKNGTGGMQTRYTRWTFDTYGRNSNETYQWTGTTALPVPAGGTAGEVSVEKVSARNAFGQPLTILDIDGVTTTNKYGTFGRLQHTYANVGYWETTTYYEDTLHCPAAGTKIRVKKKVAGGQVLESCLDALGREIRSVKLGFKTGETIFQEKEYDYRSGVKRQALPHLSTVTGASIKWETNTYDDLARVVSVVHADGSQDVASYDGFKTTQTNALNQVRSETRNVLGELILVVEPLGAFISYSYDVAGNLTKTTVGNNYPSAPSQTHEVTMSYDVLGRKVSMNDPDKGMWTYAYNAFGELVEQLDGKSQKSVMTYDVLGRMRTNKEYWSNSILARDNTWAYDSAGVFGTRAGKLITSVLVSYNTAGIKQGQEFKVYSYDGFGRSTGYGIDLNDSQVNAVESVTYDQHGRVFQQFDMTDDYWGVEYQYNTRGYLSKLMDSRYEDVNVRSNYLTISKMDAFGNVTEEILGNGVTVTRSHHADTGRLLHIGATATTTFDRQDLTMTYDALGNLKSRHDQRESYSLKESFCYDSQNRLIKSHANTLVGSCAGLNENNGDFRYNTFGNMTYKQGVGTYTYGSSKPHAVTAAGSSTYAYDANGNMTSGKGATFTYGAFDKATRISRTGGDASDFEYGIDKNRYKRTDTIGSNITKTWYVGDAELIQRPGGAREIKRRIAGSVIVTHAIDGSNAVTSTTTQYLLKDHLGSVVAVLDSNKSNVEAMAFDPWGHRRAPGNWTTLEATYQPLRNVTNTTRGYTGHEEMDALGLIHMNGRVYDPYIGRFTQADPLIQAPGNTQSYNRYSYVLSNPLRYTDPSGYSWREWAGPIVAVAGTAICYGNTGCGAAAYAAIGAASGGAGAAANGGNILQGIAIGGVSGAAFYAVGAADFSSFGGAEGIVEFAAYGTVGGTSSALSGGKFGHGFISAGIGGSTAGPIGRIEGLNTTDAILRTTIRAVVAGTVSDMTGGKFANGAATAAFASMVSEAAYKYSDAGRGGSGEDWWTGYEMPGDIRARYDYALAMDWTGAISVLGGTAQLGTGILACSSLVGCAGGAYLGAHGLNNIYEGFTGETGLLREGYRAIFGENWGDIAYGAADVGTSVHGATKLVLKPDAWKLFRHIPSDYVRAYSITSTPALMGQGTVDAVTIYDTYQRVNSK